MHPPEVSFCDHQPEDPHHKPEKEAHLELERVLRVHTHQSPPLEHPSLCFVAEQAVDFKIVPVGPKQTPKSQGRLDELDKLDDAQVEWFGLDVQPWTWRLRTASRTDWRVCRGRGLRYVGMNRSGDSVKVVKLASDRGARESQPSQRERGREMGLHRKLHADRRPSTAPQSP